MKATFTHLLIIFGFLSISNLLSAQSETALQPILNPEGFLAAQNSNSTATPLYLRYAFKAVPRGGENPKKADEAVLQTGLQKNSTNIQTAIKAIVGVHSCAFDYAKSEVYFWVLRSETQKREVVTELSRVLDSLGFQYDLETVTLYK